MMVLNSPRWHASSSPAFSAAQTVKRLKTPARPMVRFGADQPPAKPATPEQMVLFLDIWHKAGQIPAPLIDKTAVINGISAYTKPGGANATLVDQKMADALGGIVMNEITNTPVPVHAGDFIMEYGPGDKYVSCPEQIVSAYTFKDGSPLQDKDGKLLISPGEPTDLIKQITEVRVILPSPSHTHVLTQECMQKAIAEGKPPEGEPLRPNHVILTNLNGFPYQQTAEWFLKKLVPAPNDKRGQRFFERVKKLVADQQQADAAEKKPKAYAQPNLPFMDECPPDLPDGYHMATDMTWRMIIDSTKMFAGFEEPPTYLTTDGKFTEDPNKGKRLKGVWATPYTGGVMHFLNDPKNEWMDPDLCHADTFPTAASGFMIMLLNAVTKAKRQMAWNVERRDKIRKDGSEQHKAPAEIEAELAKIQDPTEIVLLKIKAQPDDKIIVRDNIHVFNEKPSQRTFFESARPFDPEEPILNTGKLPEFIYQHDVPIVREEPGQPPLTRITKAFTWPLDEARKIVERVMRPKENKIVRQKELFTMVTTENGIEYKITDWDNTKSA